MDASKGAVNGRHREASKIKRHDAKMQMKIVIIFCDVAMDVNPFLSATKRLRVARH
jgi:hypothetical protein